MKYGEIVELGRHRLMCGDATKREDVEALVAGCGVDLVLTDPPYGIKIVQSGGWFSRYRPILNDTDTQTARLNWEITHDLTDKLIIWGGNYFTDFLPVSGGWLFWDKCRPKGFLMGDGELAWMSWGCKVRKYTQSWNGNAIDKTYNPSPHVHPTQKPVELHARILEDFSRPDSVILDCFGGSGTTLIACEITGRTCLMMELSPDYCGVIIDRYNKLTRGNIPYTG